MCDKVTIASSPPSPSIFGVGLFDQQVTSHYFPVHRKANYYFDGFDKGTESAFLTSFIIILFNSTARRSAEGVKGENI